VRIERRQDYAGALEQFDKIIEIAQKKKDDGRLADAFRLKGLAYKDKGEVGNAREAIKKSLEIERARLSYGGIATAEEQLATSMP
jgi:tetratricopeptide (TPR) repeat protein